MTTREPALQTFLSSIEAALATRDLGTDGAVAINRIFGALADDAPPGSGETQRLPVCGDNLPAAYETARRGPHLAQVVDALAAIEPWFYWAPRSAGGPHASPNWPDGHANAMIVGPGGLENRADLQIGVSLMAPNVRYPDHTHAPEEVYLVLSPGRFQHGESGWFEPGVGGTLYNTPGIRHAMASDAAPLFAIWLLWTGKPAAAVPA